MSIMQDESTTRKVDLFFPVPDSCYDINLLQKVFSTFMMEEKQHQLQIQQGVQQPS